MTFPTSPPGVVSFCFCCCLTYASQSFYMLHMHGRGSQNEQYNVLLIVIDGTFWPQGAKSCGFFIISDPNSAHIIFHVPFTYFQTCLLFQFWAEFILDYVLNSVLPFDMHILYYCDRLYPFQIHNEPILTPF